MNLKTNVMESIIFTTAAVVLVVIVVFNQVMYTIGDNQYGFPRVYFTSMVQQVSFYAGVSLFYLLSILGWVIQIYYIYNNMEPTAIRPFSWTSLITGGLIFIADINSRSQRDEDVPGSMVATISMAVSILALCYC